MVVVAVTGHFVTVAASGQRHGGDLARLQQRFDIAVDGGHADARHGLLRVLENFLRRERAPCGSDALVDGGALAGISFHSILFLGAGRRPGQVFII